ncbi:Zn-ribbon domain-containing OB-fold protein [Actinoplanes sp. HUAS TT8]|uniref:Zn-ribbon domain-containing OB-fold protein n=1 Tax=Actinoplanes sp. HUAS TT8 TaxID=3447453 RepID=UPI003F51AEDD
MRTIQKCLACGRLQHPARSICLTCGSADHLENVSTSGNGIVDSFTVVHRADEPYVLARIRLDEGPIVLSHLVDDPDPRCDQRVHLIPTEPPVFAPGRHVPPAHRSE